MKKTILFSIIIGLFFACEIVAQTPGKTLRTKNYEGTNNIGYIINGYLQLQTTPLNEKSDPLMNYGFNDYYTKGVGGDSNINVIGRALYGPADCVFTQGSYSYVGAGGALLIFNCSDPDTSLLVGSIYLGKHTYGSAIKYIYVKDNYAYIANNYEGLWIIDVSDPASPFKAAEVSIQGSSLGVYVQGGYAYVTTYFDDEQGGLWIIDISDPVNPQIVGNETTIGASYGICVKDSCAYIGSKSSEFKIIDISNPSNPYLISSLTLSGGLGVNIQVSENIAYIAAFGEGLIILDVSDPHNPFHLTTYTPPGWNPMFGHAMLDIVVSTPYVYLAAFTKGFYILDCFDPQNPNLLGSVESFISRSITLSGVVVYSAGDFLGFSVIDVFDFTYPVEISRYKTDNWCSDVSVIDDYAYVCDFDQGIKILDISDIHNPIKVASYSWPQTNVYSSFIKDTLLYVSCIFGHSLRVLNIADPLNPTEVAIYTDYDAYNIQVIDNLLYATTSDDLFYILNVANPAHPSLVGSYTVTGGNSVFTFGLKVSDIENERYAFVAANEAGVVVIDVTDPTNPLYVASIPCNNGYDVDVSGNYLYISEQGIWPTVAGGVKVVDITDPANPIIMGSYSGVTGFDIAVSGNLVYLATAYMGLRVIDVSDPSQPIEVGYYYTGSGQGARGITLQESGGEFPYVFVAHTHEGLWIDQFTGTVGIEENNTFSSKDDMLLQSYPNPFNSNTTISYQLKEAGKVILNIYNIQGQLVNKLVDEYQENGKHSILWNGTDDSGNPVSSGIYFYKMECGNKYSGFKKMILMK